MKKLFSLSTGLAVMLAACAATAAPAADRSGMLADGKGMTLYTFTKDTPNTSACYDGCAKAWPPFIAADATKANTDFTVVQRTDGTRQWAFKGQPLYYFAGDAAPGESKGEGSGGVWFVVRADKPSPAKSTGGGGYRY